MATTTRSAAPTAPAVTTAQLLALPGPGLAAAIFFGISLVYFLPAFLPGEHVYGTDYLGGGYFFYDFISSRFAAGSLPKWVPYIFGGMPLFANPGSTFYPIHVLGDLLFPTAKVLPFVFWFQFGIAGLGMYLLARELGCRPWVAFVAGLAFQFTGITMSWVYAGHDGRIIVATLAPLFFFFLHAGVRTGRVPAFAGAAATVGFALLSFQIQTAYYLLIAGAIWAAFSIYALEAYRDRARLVKTVALGLLAVGIGFAMSAVNFIPFLGYMPESTRGEGEGRGYDYAVTYSMPEGEILSMAVPEQAGASVGDPTTGEPLFPEYRGENGFKLHTEYLGALVVVLTAVGAYFSRRNRYWWFFGGLALFFLTISLGGNTPLYRLYSEILPGNKRFRAPSLSFFVVAMSLVTMAGLTLERLAALRDEADARRDDDDGDLPRAGWIAVGVVALAVVGAGMLGTVPVVPGMPSPMPGWQRFILFASAISAVLWFWTRASLGWGAAALLLAGIGLTDLWTMDRRFFHTVAPPEVQFAPDDVVSFIQAQGGRGRVWSLPLPGIGTWGGSGSYGGDYPMYFGIEQVGGEHPNPIHRWNEYVGAGTESYIDWHNLLIEPQVVGDSLGQALAFRSAPGLLDAANVRWVVSMAPLVHPALREVHRGSALVYENATAMPRAYLVPAVREAPAGATLEAMLAPGWNPAEVAVVEEGAGIQLPATPLEGSASVATYEPDRVVVRTEASRPALLVLADNVSAGWEARVDGEPAEIHRANHAFRGVVVPAGTHEVEFVFDPGELYTGLYIYIAVLALLAGYAAFLLFRGVRGRAASVNG